jgi:hypothetical protein
MTPIGIPVESFQTKAPAGTPLPPLLLPVLDPLDAPAPLEPPGPAVPEEAGDPLEPPLDPVPLLELELASVANWAEASPHTHDS